MQTIAIVNNERNLVRSLTLNLEAAGYEVRAFHRTDVALDALVRTPADLALIDKTNPPLGGIELLRRLRRHTTMPVLFLSAWADEVEEGLRGSGLEAEGYIQIPVSLAALIDRVRAALLQSPRDRR